MIDAPGGNSGDAEGKLIIDGVSIRNENGNYGERLLIVTKFQPISLNSPELAPSPQRPLSQRSLHDGGPGA